MNIVEPIIKNIIELPEATALVDLSGGKEHHISFFQLGAAVSAAIREIERLGIDSQNCVAINFKDPALDLVYFVALSALGVGVYPVASFSGIEMVVIERLGISICINDIKNVSMPIKSVSVRNILRNGNVSNHQDLLVCDLKNCSDRPWLVRNTSGTTGNPKVFFSSHLDGASRRRRYEEMFDIASSSFLSFTLAHFGAARQRLFYSLCAGRTVFPVSRNFSFKKIISIINSFKIDLIYAVPLHLEGLIGEAEVRDEEILFEHLPILECTSSLLRDDVEKYVKTKVTPNLVNAYSFSELGHICATETPHGSARVVEKHPESSKMSRFVSGVEVQIKNSSGKSLGPNEKGLVAVRLNEENFSVNYLDSNGKWISSLKDGWFYPGDLGAKSLVGDLTIFGRTDDMLIFNGINIHPSEIERAARRCTHVKDAVAFGISHKLHYQVPVVAVTSSNEFNKDYFLKEIKRVLGNKAPVICLPVMDFPRNSMGKILRRKMAEEFGRILGIGNA
jgi:acyl-coenzyme A synthetase/AMP-(fatty) acid ligase